MPSNPVEFLNVSTPQGASGVLTHAHGAYYFQYTRPQRYRRSSA